MRSFGERVLLVVLFIGIAAIARVSDIGAYEALESQIKL